MAGQRRQQLNFVPPCSKKHSKKQPVSLNASWNRAARNSTADGAARPCPGPISVKNSRFWARTLNHELESVAFAPNPARVEMATDHQGRAIGETREQLTPCHGRLQRIGVGG